MADLTPWKREATARTLIEHLKGTAYTCAAINASVCASYPPKLYVATRQGDQPPRVATGKRMKAMEADAQAERVEEVTDHPALDLLAHVNPEMNGYDLLELTTMYQEVVGMAYWLVERGLDGMPSALWPLPPHLVTRTREGYDYWGPGERQTYTPDEVIAFRYPDPRNPYAGGLSPMRAAFDQITLDAEFVAFKNSVWRNRAVPGLIVSPDEAISPAERERIEEEYRQRFTRGGQGETLVTEGKVHVHVLKVELGDVATLAEQAFSKEQIANAFGVPLAMLTKDTNLANLQASLTQHAILTVRPRLERRDSKLNERLIPMYDPTGRLFFASDDPADAAEDARRAQEKQDLDTGVRTINEVRAVRGLEPVPWGNSPWLPLANAPADLERRADHSPRIGRNSDPDRGNPDAT